MEPPKLLMFEPLPTESEGELPRPTGPGACRQLHAPAIARATTRRIAIARRTDLHFCFVYTIGFMAMMKMARKSGRIAGLWLALIALRLAGGIDGIRVASRVLGRAGHGKYKLQSGAGTWRSMPASVLQLRGGGDGGGMAEDMEEADSLGDDDKLPVDERIVKGELENGFRC